MTLTMGDIDKSARAVWEAQDISTHPFHDAFYGFYRTLQELMVFIAEANDEIASPYITIVDVEKCKFPLDEPGFFLFVHGKEK